MSIAVSVVLPTYRRPALLCRCIKALQAQTFAPEQFEVIVVDDAADHKIETLLASLALEGSISLRYLKTEGKRGPARARNLGWQAARGATIAFTDDDCVPDCRWLEEGLRTMRQQKLDGGWGKIEVPLPEKPTDYERDTGRLAEATFVTANCFCTHDALSRCHGFDERFTAAWREDSDLFFTLQARGARLFSLSNAVVVHPVRKAHWGVSISQQRKNQFNALLYKKHPERYRNFIQSRAPLHYYGMLFGVAVTLSGATTTAHGWIVAGSSLWAILFVAFVAKRLQRNSLALSHIGEVLVTSFFIPPLAIFWRLYGACKYRVPFI